MRTADICPTCATFTNALCTLYNGSPLVNIDVNTLDSLESVLQKINSNLVPVHGTIAPTQNALYVGQYYINTTNNIIYYAISVGNGASDWLQIGNGLGLYPTLQQVTDSGDFTTNSVTIQNELDVSGSLYLGYAIRGGLQADSFTTLLGAWAVDNGTQLKIDDDSKNFQFWCYNYNEDHPIAQFNGNGSSSFGWGNLTIDNTGILTSKTQLSVNNPAANDGFGAYINITTDQIQSAGTNSNEDNYSFNLNNQGVGGYYPIDIGTQAGWYVNYNGVAGYNTDNNNNGSWGININGAYITTLDGVQIFSVDQYGNITGKNYSDNYQSWSISQSGNITLGGNPSAQNITALNSGGIFGESASLGYVETWHINTSDGSVKFDNGAITSNGNGSITAPYIGLGYNTGLSSSTPVNYLSELDGQTSIGDVNDNGSGIKVLVYDGINYSPGVYIINSSTGITQYGAAFFGSDGSGYLDNGYIGWYQGQFSCQSLIAGGFGTDHIRATPSPLEGLTIYNIDLHTLCFYNGSQWRQVSHTAM